MASFVGIALFAALVVAVNVWHYRTTTVVGRANRDREDIW